MYVKNIHFLIVNLKIRESQMKKISKRFDEIWRKAEKRNNTEGMRFHKIYSQNKRYITMGVYDSVSKKYSTFDTINLIGNFRYNTQTVPAEFDEMEKIVTG